MKKVIEALKKRANGSRAEADRSVELAKQLRNDADRVEEDVAALRSEADELDRIRIAMYGKD